MGGRYVSRGIREALRRLYELEGDGSIFVTSGGVNASLTIEAIAARTAAYIIAQTHTGELWSGSSDESKRRVIHGNRQNSARDR